jgi:hypothetical protein
MDLVAVGGITQRQRITRQWEKRGRVIEIGDGGVALGCGFGRGKRTKLAIEHWGPEIHNWQLRASSTSPVSIPRESLPLEF